MAHKRVLAIGLDGFDEAYGNLLIESGDLPTLAALKKQSATWSIDHGKSTLAALDWEQFTSGLSPEISGRWSPVHFDKYTYNAWQEGVHFTPFVDGINRKIAVFDVPYFDINRVENSYGVIDWGRHDPAVGTVSSPGSLIKELINRFGNYPAKDWVYGIPWNSVENTRLMGKLLSDAADVRTQATRWLLKERLPDWDLALVVATEIHSATEGLWFGVDEEHPLNRLESAMAAKDGLRSVYKAVDHLVGNLVEIFPDAQIIIFSLGGMGPNRADIPGMILLPELLYRKSFRKPLLEPRKDWEYTNNGIANLMSDESWSEAIEKQYAVKEKVPDYCNNFPEKIKNSFLRKIIKHRKHESKPESKYYNLSLNWMPAMYYSPYWKYMDAFALPSFNAGRIRINLKGRERNGRIPIKRYYQFVENLKEYLLHCQTSNGESVIRSIDTTNCINPLELDPSDADLIVDWNGINQEIFHPETGAIGPVPFRRTGGHLEKSGITYIYNTNTPDGYYGLRSAYDIVPTIFTMMEESIPPAICGTSLI